VYGRVPLLYYVLHIYLIHIMAILVSLAFRQPIWYGTIIADFAQKPPATAMGYLSSTPCGFWPSQSSICPAGGFMEFGAGTGIGLGFSYL